MRPEQMLPDERAALDRLFDHAQRDTGQSPPISCWRGGTPARAARTTLQSAGASMTTLPRICARCSGLPSGRNSYPDTLGYGLQFEAVMRAWRSELIDHKESFDASSKF